MTYEELKKFWAEHELMDVNDDYEYRCYWDKYLAMLNSPGFIDFLVPYMKTDMTEDEYGILTEVVDEISPKVVTQEFVEQLKIRNEKEPHRFMYELIEIFEKELASRGDRP